jgi:FkbM family methyltransferase
MARFSNVYVYHTALGSSPGTATFHQNAFTKASSLLQISDLHRQAFGWTDAGAPIDVPVDTLDSALDAGRALELEGAGCVLLKLDAQGFELEVLKGATRTLSTIDHVLVETSVGGALYEGEATFDDVYRMLTGRGFRFAGIWDQMRDPRNDSPLQVDALFSRA